MADSRTPPDHTLRQNALNPRASFIVQAPAGSGKTELLVRRYLKLLAQVKEPEQILAITFTKKATAEMHQRVWEALASVDKDGDSATEDNPQLLTLAEAVRTRDAQLNWQLITNPRRLRIHTIDAFCNELVRRMPWSARFGAPPKIVEDPLPLYRLAATRTLEHIERDTEWSSASQKLLELVDADWNKSLDLLTDMLKKRDKWMRILGGSHAADRKILEEMWQQHSAGELHNAAQSVPRELQDQLIPLGASAANHLVDAQSQSPITALHNAQNFPPPDHNHLTEWHAIAELVLTKDGTVRKTVTKNHGFPPTDKNKTAEENKTNQANKEKMMSLLSQLATQPQTIAVLREVRWLPMAEFSDAQWNSLSALMQLLRLAAGELRMLFKEQNQADYIELTQRAEMALGDPHNPSDLALAFDYQIAHILMDEFQDTSTAHIELLTKLTAGWQRDDGRTLFFVGDPMQSIYRFREAEVGNFLKVWEERQFGDIPVTNIALETNFRSVPKLVGWFNGVFPEVMPTHNDQIKSAVKYAAAQPYIPDTNDGNPAIHIDLDPDRPAQIEANAIAARIAEEQRQNPKQTIAVLGRTRGHLHTIATTLRQQEIKFQAVDLEKLDDRPGIRDLTAITRALAQPADRIAWLSLLRAPWCGMHLADIATLTASQPTKTPTKLVWELLCDDQLVAKLSAPGQSCLKRLRECLAAALPRRSRISLRQNVESTWLALGGPATVTHADLEDSQRYLALLSKMEAEQIEINAESLKHASEDLWAQGDSETLVQLLTIHKAKGLEFDTVFLPRLEGVPRASDKALLRWRNLPPQLLIAPLPSNTEPDDDFYQYLAHIEKTHAQNEIGRLFYVACTRAKKNLYLFGKVKVKNEKSGKRIVNDPPANSFLSSLWPSVQDEYTKALGANSATTPNEEVGKTNEFCPQQLEKLPLNWALPELPETIHSNPMAGDVTEPIEFSWAGEIARITGVLIHRILQQVDPAEWAQWSQQPPNENQKSRWQNQLIELGIPKDDLAVALKRVLTAIEKAQCDPHAEWIFSHSHRDIKTEWPLAGLVDGTVVHIVIDRSFIDENGIRWIIDFKSSAHEGTDLDTFLDREQQRHKQQLARYAVVVGQLSHQTTAPMPPREIRLGLYFPALQGWREWTE